MSTRLVGIDCTLCSYRAIDSDDMRAHMADHLASARRALQTARKRYSATTTAGAEVVIAAAAAGISEVAIASALDVNRLTVRRWLGKPRRR